MKKNLKKVVLVLALLLPGVIKAQEFNVTAKADFVSDYIWRGAYQNSGFSVQPTLGLSYGNLSLSAWGSQSLTKTDGAQEFDINLSYTIGGLGITVTDYWWNGITMPYGDYKHDHHFEGTLAYNFGENFPLTLSWSTMFAGGDDNKDGDRAYSTYINASYNIACPAEITLTPSVGFTPWKGMYDADGAAFTDIALKASKNINITDHFSLPLFVQAIVSPTVDDWIVRFRFDTSFYTHLKPNTNPAIKAPPLVLRLIGTPPIWIASAPMIPPSKMPSPTNVFILNTAYIRCKLDSLVHLNARELCFKLACSLDSIYLVLKL
jgi:hypothetical protein